MTSQLLKDVPSHAQTVERVAPMPRATAFFAREAWNFSALVAAQVLVAAVGLASTRFLTPSDKGLFTGVYLWSLVTEIVVGFSLPNALLYFGAKEGLFRPTRRLLSSLLSCMIVGGVIVGLYVGRHSPGHQALQLIVVLLPPAMFAFEVMTYSILAQGGRFYLYRIIQAAAFAVLALPILVITHSATLLTAALLASYVVSLMPLRWLETPQVRQNRLRLTAAKLARWSLRAHGGLTLSLLATRLDLLFVTVFFITTTAGLYAAAAAVPNLLAFGGTALGLSFARNTTAQSIVGSQRRVALWAAALLLGSLIVAAVLISFRSQLMVGLFGDAYAPAAQLLVPLSIALPLWSLAAYESQLLSAVGRPIHQSIGQGLAALLLAAGSVYGVAHHSAIAVAWSNVVAYSASILWQSLALDQQRTVAGLPLKAWRRWQQRLASTSATAIVIRVLLGEQVLIASIGIVGGLWPSQSALLLHVLIGGQLLLDAIGLAALTTVSGFRVGNRGLLVSCVVLIVLAAIGKNIHISPASAAIDLLRLLVPIAWLALTPIEEFAARFMPEIRRIRSLLIMILILQLVGLALGRLHGWGAAYLSGNPIIGLLVFPAVLEGSGVISQFLVALLAVPILIVSLKRTSWVSMAIVAAVLLVTNFRTIRLLIRGRFAMIAGVCVVIVVLFTFAIGAATQVTRRVESLGSIASNSSSDYSFSQRLQEVSSEVQRAQLSPITTLLFGLSSEEVRLPNGQYTHAIHATPIFLIFAGGLLWVFTFLIAGRSTTASNSLVPWLFTIVALGLLIDSLGGNNSLAPSFGIAVAVFHAQGRALVARTKFRRS